MLEVLLGVSVSIGYLLFVDLFLGWVQLLLLLWNLLQRVLHLRSAHLRRVEGLDLVLGVPEHAIDPGVVICNLLVVHILVVSVRYRALIGPEGSHHRSVGLLQAGIDLTWSFLLLGSGPLDREVALYLGSDVVLLIGHLLAEKLSLGVLVELVE